MNNITGSIDNSELQQALSGLSTVLGRGKGPHPAADSNPTSILRALLVGKAQAKRDAGDELTAKALETIIMQHDLGLIELSWDAWKGTVIVSTRIKD